MIIKAKAQISAENIHQIQKHLECLGATLVTLHWKDVPVFVTGGLKLTKEQIDELKLLGVDECIPIATSHKLVSRKFQPETSKVRIGNVVFGGNQVPVIAGPCSVETAEQMAKVVAGAKSAGCQMIRGGAYKPRTSPYSFQGHGETGLKLLCGAAHPQGMAVVSEIMDASELDLFMKYNVDAIQVGTRNMQNFALLKILGQTRTPIILKRGMSATISEWLMAAEYIAAGGNSNIILCERGIRTFETAYRNVLDVTGVMVAKRETHLPVIVDPSHAGGKSWMVADLAKAAIAVGADGLLIEMHPVPKESWCDAEQTISIEAMQKLMPELDAVAVAIGRHITGQGPLCAC